MDGGYEGKFIDGVKNGLQRVVEVVKRPAFTKGFVLRRKRWRVEQAIGALTIGRRLKFDYKTLIHISAVMMMFASITRLLASITLK